MDIIKAKRIEELRTNGASMRRVAEEIEKEFPQYPELSGNQLHGQDLIYEALEFLYRVNINEINDETLKKWHLR